MINVQHLSQSFGNRMVLDDVSIQIGSNEICALVGRNGAGKSTFINSLLGILPVKKGFININGEDVTKKRKRSTNEIAYLPEKFMLYPLLTGYENLVFFAKIRSKQLDTAKMESILRAVNLWNEKDMTIKNYSKGMLQRLGIAITLYQDSSILVLDEPTSGLDPMGRKEILDTLKGLKNKTILLSSHHIDEIKQLCTHVAYLEDHHIQKYTVEDFLQTHYLGENEQ